jgi:nitroreductase
LLGRVGDYYSSSPETASRAALANAFVAVHQALLRAEESKLWAWLVTEFDEPGIKTYLHVPDHFLVAALLPLGYSEESRPPALWKTASSVLVYNEKFGETSGPATQVESEGRGFNPAAEKGRH